MHGLKQFRFWSARSAFLGAGFTAAIILGRSIVVAECEDNGPVEVGCGSGETDCETNAAGTSCKRSTMRKLGTGDFECGAVLGAWDCGTSNEYKDVCYTDYNCVFDINHDPRCYKDQDSDVKSKNWIKEARDCIPEA